MISCRVCKERKNENDFYENHYECKRCWNKYCSDRRKRLKESDPTFLEKRRKYLQEWREKNKHKNESYWRNRLKKEKETGYANRKNPEYRKMANQSVKKWRKQNIERFAATEKSRRDRDREHERARRRVYKALTRGHMTRPNECSKCRKICKPDAHHEDYTKPLEITWLCRICHRHAQGKLLDIKP